MNATDRTISAADPPRRTRPMRLLALALAAGVVAIAAVMGLQSHTAETPWSLTAGRIAGMTALALFMMQFVLSGRVKWQDRAFGLDSLYRAHAALGAAAAVLASTHPFLVYFSGLHSTSLEGVSWRFYRPQLIGAAVLIIAWLIVVTAVWRVFLSLSYEAWRWVHRLTFVVVAAGLAHAFGIGADLQTRGWVWWLWVVAAGAYAVFFIWVKLIRPLGRRRKFVVESVERPSHNTVSVVLKPLGRRGFEYLPGQFAFVRFRSKLVERQQHPFTISSSPSRPDAISFTIKQSGDFTNTLEHLRPQDKARLSGPFGRFSHVLRSKQGETLVMIAGGIGITPMLSMLRHVADTNDTRSVTLIWSNRTEDDIIFREEIAELERRLAGLTVHHVLTRQPDWPGETGRLDRDMLRRLLTDDDCGGRAFICGPAGMISSVSRHLRKLGFPRRKIHAERFALA